LVFYDILSKVKKKKNNDKINTACLMEDSSRLRISKSFESLNIFTLTGPQFPHVKTEGIIAAPTLQVKV
jgi:hypothetical protein